MNSKEQRILNLKPGSEFLFSFTGSRTWRERHYKVLEDGIVELLTMHTHRESTPYPEGPQPVDADSIHRFTTLERIAKESVGGFTVFKEL